MFTSTEIPIMNMGMFHDSPVIIGILYLESTFLLKQDHAILAVNIYYTLAIHCW